MLGAGAPGTLGGRQGGPGPSVWNRVPGALGGGSVSAGRAWVGCAQEGRSRRNRRVEFLEGSGGNGRLRPGRLRAGGAQPQRCGLRALGVTQSWVTLVSRDCAENLVAVLTVVWCETPTKPNLANAPEHSPCRGGGGAGARAGAEGVAALVRAGWGALAGAVGSASVRRRPRCALLSSAQGVVKGGSKQEDAWITPFVKQFSGIGFAVSASPRGPSRRRRPAGRPPQRLLVLTEALEGSSTLEQN